jgi:uroporphyrinogen decarboxylase
MNGIERVRAALGFQKPDRVPAIAQVFGHAATVAGVPLRDYISDGELLARCQEQALQRYDHDAVFALMDASVETEAVGSILSYPQDQYPHVEVYALSDAENLERISVPDPRRAGRMPELLRAASHLRRDVGDDVLVIGCVSGPMTVALQLLGAEKALYLAIDCPERFTHLLDFATEVAIRFGAAQIEAGAHLPLVFDPCASPAVIPYQFFREFVLSHLQRLFSALKDAGAAASWLHIAGPTGSILPFLPQCGVDMVTFDYCVSPLEAQRAIPHTCLVGNIKPLSFVMATPEEIAEESSRLLNAFGSRGGFILSSGCEIPPEAEPENVAAMVSAVPGR